MPPTIRQRPLSEEDDTVEVPRRVAFALRPSVNRDVIPDHVDLSTNAPPYSGETREQQVRILPGGTGLNPGARITMVNLRRAWNFVGFIVKPGDNDGGGGGLVANLWIINRGLVGALPDIVVPVGRIAAFPPIIMGARVELTLTNNTFNPIFGLGASLWGMSER
jgi:hypothetical protein